MPRRPRPSRSSLQLPMAANLSTSPNPSELGAERTAIMHALVGLGVPNQSEKELEECTYAPTRSTVGESVNDHGRKLKASARVNIEKVYNIYSGQKRKQNDIQTLLAPGFRDQYALKLIEERTLSCLDIYLPSNLLIFIGACGYHKTARTVSIAILLKRHGETPDFCYFLADMCDLMPTYLWKQRSLAVVKHFLKQLHLPLLNRYAIKVQADQDIVAVRKWCNECISQAGMHRPHWSKHVISRMRVVQVPKCSWDLKLVSIQRTVKNYD